MGTLNNIIEKKQTQNEKLFLGSFIVVILLKCLNLSEISNYIPYSYFYMAYMIIWGALAILSSKGHLKRKILPSTIILLALACFYIIWGFHNINGINYDNAFGNMMRSLFYVFFIGISAFWVKKFGCLYRFIKVLFYTFAAYIIFWIIVSIPQINVLSTLKTFFSDDNNIRYRNYIGFSYPNLGGEMAACTIILSKVVFKQEKNKQLQIKIINILMFFGLIINNSRGSLLALLLFELLYLFLINKNDKKAVKKVSRLVTISVILVLSIVIYLINVKGFTLLEILQGTNRQAALYENIKLLQNSGQWLMGIGRLTGGFFSDKNMVYGAQTGYLEVFYFEVFITSGIIGSVFMTFVVFYIIRKIIKSSSNVQTYLGKWFFCVYIYMLFVSLFEVYLFTYIYATSMCLNVLVLSYIDMCSRKVQIEREEVSVKTRALSDQAGCEIL